MDNPEELLRRHGIRPTAVRLIVLREMQRADSALSLTDLEARLGTVDKSSIFRTLQIFTEHHLAHSIDDGRGIAKYGLCPDGCHCNDEAHEGLADLHLHFTCEHCHKTFCFHGIPLPSVAVPTGFHVHTANYMLIGLCPDCRRHARCHRAPDRPTPEAD